MFSFETLIYGCLMFTVPLHCCQNLTLPNVPTWRLLPGNPTTAASATVWGLNGRRQGHELWPQSDGYVFCCGWSHTCNGSWELGIELQWSLSEVITPWWRIEDQTFADDFLRLFDMSFQKNVKSHVFLKSEKNEKYVFSSTGMSGINLSVCVRVVVGGDVGSGRVAGRVDVEDESRADLSQPGRQQEQVVGDCHGPQQRRNWVACCDPATQWPGIPAARRPSWSGDPVL